MSFYLVRVDPGGVETPLPDHGPYDTGPEASLKAKALTAQLGFKVQPRRMRQAPNWKERQARRLELGELTALPSEWDLPPIPDHFAHISKKNPSLIAFTADDEQGILDRVTPIRPGSYLQRFYPELSDPIDLKDLAKRLKVKKPSEDQIAAEYRRLSENTRKRYAGMIDKGLDMMLATTPEQIEWVYESGTENPEKGSMVSCMTRSYQKTHHHRPNFLSPVHPVQVYGAGDLAVAYTVGKSGNVSERCVVWPEKLQHGAIYSDGSGRLSKMLEEAGYTNKRDVGFDGARLLRIHHHNNGSDYFVLPHIDLNHTSPRGSQKVYDDGEFLIIDAVRGTMNANAISGLTAAVFHQNSILRAA